MPNLHLDVGLLREQYQWLLKQEDCDEREGLLNLVEHLMGYNNEENTND